VLTEARADELTHYTIFIHIYTHTHAHTHTHTHTHAYAHIYLQPQSIKASSVGVGAVLWEGELLMAQYLSKMPHHRFIGQ